MPEYLAPGVYIEELSTGPKPIEGVSTSTAAFLGMTERGPIPPRMVTSWLDFQRWYGGYLPLTQSYLPYAVQGFFDNGGQRLFIGRILSNNATVARQVVDTRLVISAIGPGAWGNTILIRIGAARQRSERNPDWFSLAVLYYRTLPDMANFVDPLEPANATNANRVEPDVIEIFDNLVHTVGASNNVEAVVNSGSRLVRTWFNNQGPAPIPVPDDPVFGQLANNASDGDPVAVGTFTGNLEPIDASSPRSTELLGQGRGLAAVEAIDEVSLLAIPDEVRTQPDLRQLTQDVIQQCERLKDRFAVVSVRRGENNDNIRPPQDTTYASFYAPWIEVYDPVSRGPILIPPTGHITGLIARTDIERGVHKAPANEVVRDATNLEFPMTKGRQDILNPRGVNCIRDFRSDVRGIRLWGARTMTSNPEWKYINVRRLFIFVEESIEQGTQWVVFEPNDEPLWAQVRRSIVNFLTRVWKSGALMGLTQDEAFFVKCDRTTMTQDDIDNGRLVCYIGIAPVKPAEFVIFRISQKTADAPA
jgi:phage tail sheath protein FI